MKLLDEKIKKLLHHGQVIPAHPLALTRDRQLDEERQRLLTRYYMASGVGGIAVGVHTTQFEIRDPKIGLYQKVLALAIAEIERTDPYRTIIKVAGVSGTTEQAVNEARIADKLGYDIVLVSTNGLGGWSEAELLSRARAISKVMPIFGFYLQPAVGGRVLSYDFWLRFSEIENVYAIKMAPFNRYQTLEVVRAVCNSTRQNDIALYTGNDDNIVADLLTTYKIQVEGKIIEKDIVGGLLGHWAVWTTKAVLLLKHIHKIKKSKAEFSQDLMAMNIAVTDANAAFFDAANNFRGCIAGIHEVLRRQGLLEGIWCLNEHEVLSEGQIEEIDRVYNSYPDLNDDAFVKNNIESWRADLNTINDSL